MPDLDAWVDRMVEVKRHGFPLQDAVPVFHATDSYAKHRLKLMKWYKKKFDILRLRVQHATPKADAAGVEVLKDEQSPVCPMQCT